MLNERRQIKIITCYVTLPEMSRKGKSIETEQITDCLGMGLERGITANVHEESFRDDGDILILNCDDGSLNY